VSKQSFGESNPQSKTGVLTEIVRNLQLTWHLLTDRRVGLPLKLIIPGLMLGYMIFPADLLPDFIPVLGQVDDLALLALAIKLFIDLSPKEIVREYRGEASDASAPAGPNSNGEIVDADYRVVK
jgi:uncharacterized membrane protein YkvA (DUF1232 family)